jgi:hypothetical protein
MRKTHAAVSELASLLDGSSVGELIPELARHGLQQLIELEASAAVGADGHERSEERTNYRYGYRPRTLTTQVGDRALQIPKLRADQALYAVMRGLHRWRLHPGGRFPYLSGDRPAGAGVSEPAAGEQRLRLPSTLMPITSTGPPGQGSAGLLTGRGGDRLVISDSGH